VNAAGRWLLRLLGLATAVGVAALLLALRPAEADPAAVQVLAGGPASAGLAITEDRSRIELQPAGPAPDRGLIFYPGGLVDPRAYAAMLAPVAEQGWYVAIVKFPYDLAILDTAAGAAIVAEQPQVATWAVGGHSLGGVAAAMLVAADPRTVPNLLLWASFPNGDLSALDGVRVLSVSAANDLLSTPAEIQDSASRLPADAEFVEVAGAVHAFFGDYGSQAGDGVPTVPREQAQEEIRAATIQWLNSLAPTG
jgi:dienelactone hydrolase